MSFQSVIDRGASAGRQAPSSIAPMASSSADDLPTSSPVRIKVVGVGGAGCRALERLVDEGVPGIELVTVDTDWAAVRGSRASRKVELRGGPAVRLGSGGKIDWAARTAEACAQEIREALSGADLVHVVAGLGGGTGTGAAPVVARIAKEAGALTVAAVTLPFGFEGKRRRGNAEEGITALEDVFDAAIVVPADGLLSGLPRSTTLIGAYRALDGVQRQSVVAIAGTLATPGLIGVDFADVASVLSRGGRAGIGLGSGEGEGRAARAAVASSFLPEPLSHAGAMLVHVEGGLDLTVGEVVDVGDLIAREADPRTQIAWAATIDPRMRRNVKLTVIATGFA